MDELTRSTLTGADGTFRFVDVPAGSYRIDETQPPAYTDGPELVGSAGGAIVGSDSIGSIALGAAVVADGYVFTELAADPGSPFVRGVVFEDRDRDGLTGAGDRPMSGRTVELRELGGALLATTTSDAHGVYHFESLTIGRRVELAI